MAWWFQRPASERDFPLALVRVQYGNPTPPKSGTRYKRRLDADILKTHFVNVADMEAFSLRREAYTPKSGLKSTSWTQLTLGTFGLNGKPIRLKKKCVKRQIAACQRRLVSWLTSVFVPPCLLLVLVWLHLVLLFTKLSIYLWNLQFSIRSSHPIGQQNILWFLCFVSFRSLYSFRPRAFLFADFSIHSLYYWGP